MSQRFRNNSMSFRLAEFYNLVLNIFLINLMSSIFAYDDFIIYRSLAIILSFLIYDVYAIYKLSFINIRIFLLAGAVLWYFVPMIFAENTTAELANMIIINYFY